MLSKHKLYTDIILFRYCNYYFKQEKKRMHGYRGMKQHDLGNSESGTAGGRKVVENTLRRRVVCSMACYFFVIIIITVLGF